MPKFILDEFPDVGPQIEMPTIAELLHMPWYTYASAEELYKHGGELYRHFLKYAPIKNDRKNVIVSARVQYLDPDHLSIVYTDDWHVDGEKNPLYSRERMHLLVNDCTARTEFNTTPLAIDVNTDIHIFDLNKEIQQRKEELTGQSIEANRFVTFDVHHAHRAIPAKRHEFRFMLRIIESDSMKPLPLEKARVFESYVYKQGGENNRPDTIITPKGVAEYVNIRQTKEGVMIFK